MYEYKATILNVVDGDTFDLDIDLGFHIHVYERVRLLGIDTPEKNLRNGPEEKELGLIVAKYVKRTYEGKEVVIRSHKEKATDSFGRWLVNMEIDGIDIVSIYNNIGINKKSDSYSPDWIKTMGGYI